MASLSFAQPSLGQILPDGTPAPGSERPEPKGSEPTLADKQMKSPVKVDGKLKINHESISQALQLAEYFRDKSDGKFVFNLQLSSELSPAEKEAIGPHQGSKAIEQFREGFYLDQFGNSTIYDPNFSKSDGEVVSIRVRPADVPKTLARIGKDFPQVTKVWAVYQQYELQDMSKLPKYPEMKSVRFPRGYEFAALSKVGIEPLMTMPNGETQLIVHSESQDKWLREAARSFQEIKVTYPVANGTGTESPHVVDNEPAKEKREYYIWLRGHSRFELSSKLRDQKIEVKDVSKTRIFIYATDAQVNHLKDIDLRVYKTPVSKTET